MKKSVFFFVAFVALCGAGRVWAAAPVATNIPAVPASVQQSRIKACTAESAEKNIPKIQQKAFMSQCLKNKAKVGKL
ncbi:MAG: PsiF family protein [Alphaproteobacteria bacterium]